MTTIRCTLLRDTFEGARADNPEVAEWPPSWMRLFSALVSVADPEVDDELLKKLESTEPPEIYASPVTEASYRSAFVPVNSVVATAHTTLIGRTNSERGWARVAPRSRRISYHWPGLDLPVDQAASLASLCRRVPYLGRSTSPVVIEVDMEPPDEGERLIPSTEADPARFAYATSVRSPYPGALDALREAHDAKYLRGEAGFSWEVGIGIDYGVERPREAVAVEEGPYRSIVVLALEGNRLDGRHTARVTSAFRRAVLSRASETIATLHGHHDGTVVQCAFLGLPYVGAEYADGRLLGVGIALPEMERADLGVISEALPAPGQTIHVTASTLGVLSFRRISPLDARRRRWGLEPSRWVGPSAGTTTWITALPMVLDRFPKGEANVQAKVRRSIVNSRFPEPEHVIVSRYPMIEGGLRLSPNDTIRRRSDSIVRPYRHVVIEFGRPVLGPVVLGSMRHYGLGLCAPINR